MCWDKNGSMFLYFVVRRGNEEIVKIFLDWFDVFVDVKDSFGKIVFYLVSSEGYKNVC